MRQFLLLPLLVAGCATPAIAPTDPSVAERPALRRSITIALQGEINALTGGMNQTGIITTADREIDRIETSLTAGDRARGWAEMWRVLTDEVALLPMYYFPNPLIVRSGMTGPLPANPLTPAGHDVHTWEAR